MIQQKDRMKIISKNQKQKWLMTSETWQTTMNNLLWEWLYHSSIRKRERIFLKSIKKLQKKEKNKISNLKCWKNKNISSSKWIFREIWWQAETFRNKAERETNKINKSYIILIKMKNHLWFKTDSMMICIDEKLRKASWIRKIKEKISSRTVIKCIRSINKSINTNWAKFERWWSIHWNKWKLIWDSFTRNEKTWH